MMSFLAGLLFLAVLVFGAPAWSADLTPKAAFDSAFAWLQKNQMVDGYIVSDAASPLHHFHSTLVKAPQEFAKLGIGYIGEETIDGYPVFASSDEKTLFLVQDGNLTPVHLHKRIPQLDHFVFMGVKNGVADAAITFLYDNTDAADALMMMYDVTGDRDYLSEAGSLLKQAYDRVSPDGRYYLHFAGMQKSYKGMPQGILMRELDRYYSRSHETWANEAVIKMAAVYENTTEFTWDHWANSMNGLMVAEKHGFPVPKDLDWKASLRELLSQAKSLDGKLPQEMKRDSPEWPLHKEGYQGYILMLITKMAVDHPEVRPDVCATFPQIFKATNYYAGGVLGGRIAVAAALGKTICHAQDDGLIQKELAWVSTHHPTNVLLAVGQMMIASSAAMAEEHTSD